MTVVMVWVHDYQCTMKKRPASLPAGTPEIIFPHPAPATLPTVLLYLLDRLALSRSTRSDGALCFFLPVGGSCSS